LVGRAFPSTKTCSSWNWQINSLFEQEKISVLNHILGDYLDLIGSRQALLRTKNIGEVNTGLVDSHLCHRFRVPLDTFTGDSAGGVHTH
jgi:hypothetical protein